MAEKIAKYFERGLRDVWTRVWDNSEGDYTGDVTKWNGHTQIEISFNQEVTNLASGDDPTWAILHGALVGDITITFYDIAPDQLCNLLAVDYDEKYGMIAGGDTEAKYVGLMFSTTANNGSTNHYVFFKCAFTLPDMTHQTISDEENAVSEIEVSGSFYPVLLDSTKHPRATFIKLNDSNTGYSEYNENIVLPTFNEQ